MFWRPWAKYGQNRSPEPHFEDSGGLRPNMTNIDPLRLLLSTGGASWHPLTPCFYLENSLPTEAVLQNELSGSIFWQYLFPARPNVQNDTAGNHFGHIWYRPPKLAKCEPPGNNFGSNWHHAAQIVQMNLLETILAMFGPRPSSFPAVSPDAQS